MELAKLTLVLITLIAGKHFRRPKHNYDLSVLFLFAFVFMNLPQRAQPQKIDDYTDALPSLLTVTGQAGDENVIYLFLRWDDTATVHLLYDLRISLFLNDSDDSQYGPGVFLDACATLVVRTPCAPPATNLPGEWRMVSRIGDFGFHKRYGIILDEPELIQAGETYLITWRTAPGVAATDNAQMEFNTSWVGRCWLSGTEWPVDPLPGTQQFVPADYVDCLTTWIFLPGIKNDSE